MLVAVISTKDHENALAQIQKALLYKIDAIELRLDYFNELRIADIKKLKQSFDIPMIFTLRNKSQGGFFQETEEKRLKVIEELFAINPEYFDLEYNVDHQFIKAMHKKHLRVNLICSYHDFEKTPADLNKLLLSITKKEFSIYKIATYANSTLDSLRMLNFTNDNNKHNKVCGLCMGELGKPTRILTPVVNGALNYVSLDAHYATAPGQLNLETLFNTYHYDTINNKNRIYALLGDPVEQSIGHIFHNEQFKKTNQNAVYVKLQIKKEELPQFFKESSELPFKGFSVTMPLKEAIIPFLDELSEDAQKIKAVNTILKSNNKLRGFNTDGVGTLNAIEKIAKVKNKKIIILGAGGTVSAIIFEAIKRGAKVIVLNRTLSRAKNLAREFNCEAYSLDYVEKLYKEGYDILINATSVGMNKQKDISPLPASAIIPNTIVLDMVYKSDLTKLLKTAKLKNCVCVSGKEVFVNQALEQNRLWLSAELS